MEFLNDIWIAWNNQLGVTVATILSIIAILKSTGHEIRGLITAITHWKVWAAVRQWCKSWQQKYRKRRAMSAMRSKLAQSSQSTLRIPIRTYENCLTDNHRTSKRSALENIIPAKPGWLNDYYVATALETLSNEGKIVKATLYRHDAWGPTPHAFRFENLGAGGTVEQRVDEIETESKCQVYQLSDECLEESRYESTGSAQTTSPNTTQFVDRMKLKPGSPPCGRCWDRISRAEDIKNLVDRLTRYDFRSTADAEITGANLEFQEAVIGVCITSHCNADVSTIKGIVEQAIEIRRLQLNYLSTDQKTAWPEHLVSDFSSSLSAYIENTLR